MQPMNFRIFLTDLQMLPSFYQKMIAENPNYGSTPYIDADEVVFHDRTCCTEGCTYADRNIYLAPISTLAFPAAAYSGIRNCLTKPASIPFQQHGMSSGRVVTNLQTAGITPLALHTDGTGWAPMLLASAAVASSSRKKVLEFMSLIYPDTYQNASGLELANTLKRLFSYTTSICIMSFDTSYNNFFTGKAAMVPNGYWMIDQILTDGDSMFVFLLSLKIHWFLLRKHLAGH